MNSDNLRPAERARVVSATFSDWRTVKGRKCLQLVFEVPLESQAEVLTMLGAPMPDNPRWCAIAVMDSPTGRSSIPQPTEKGVGDPDGNRSPIDNPSRPVGETARERYHSATEGPCLSGCYPTELYVDDTLLRQLDNRLLLRSDACPFDF